MAYYENYLKGLFENPDSYQNTAGFKSGLNTGLQAVGRSNSRQRGSGNALAALTKYGTDYSQQYRGAEIDRAFRGAGQEFDQDMATKRFGLDERLGLGNLDLGRDRLGLDAGLGFGQLGLSRDRLGLDARTADQRFGLDTFRAQNDYALGSEQNQQAGQRDWWNYDLGRRRHALDESGQENDYNLRSDANARNWYDSYTNRGNARSQDRARRGY